MSKNGFSYYKAETDRFQDIKIKRLKKRYGCDGYAVYQYALNEIYRVEGAYIRWTEDQHFDCAEYWDMTEERVKEIINYCAEICLFDPIAWEQKCILTGRSIQARYLDICKVSKKKAYIPMDILMVAPEQPMQQPQAMPLFEEQGAQATPAASFQRTPETFQSTPETSGNLPEESDKENKSKAKQNENKAPSTPQRTPQEEAALLLRSLREKELRPGQAATPPPVRDATPRNPQGLLRELQRYNLSSKEEEEVLRLCNHGEIGHPVWAILNEIKLSHNIKMPRLFLLSRLRGSSKAQPDAKPDEKAAAS